MIQNDESLDSLHLRESEGRLWPSCGLLLTKLVMVRYGALAIIDIDRWPGVVIMTTGTVDTNCLKFNIYLRL